MELGIIYNYSWCHYHHYFLSTIHIYRSTKQFIISTLVTFLKPKQEKHELSEEKNDHLSGGENRKSGEKQLREGPSFKNGVYYIRNVSHEYHAPMMGITSMAEILWGSYEKLSDKQCMEVIEIIFKSSNRLKNFDANIISISKLSRPSYKLKFAQIDLSQLLYERVEKCRKLYEENKEDREFILNIEERINVNEDIHYLTQVLDNLIINAITYCRQGKITISLKQDMKDIYFTISDEGVEIPLNELLDIFDEFVVSSKTYTSAGGKGIGLAL